MRAHWRAWSLALAFGLAACGGGDTTNPDTGPAPDGKVTADNPTPVGDGQPDRKKTDGKLSCSDKCTKGISQCVGARLQQCTTQASGCTDWNPAQDCPNGKACNAGACPTCTDDCTFGNTQCSGTKVQKCGLKSNGCYGYGTPEDCPASAACAAGTCPTCVDQCTTGDTKCVGAQASTCSKASSGCLDWGAPVNCPNGTSCTGKACPTCTNECPVSASQCVGAQIKKCAIGGDGCTHWSLPVDCPNSKTCVADACPSCADNCVLGKTQCSGTQVQTCELKSSGCTDWGTATSCPGGTSCSNNQCACTLGDHRCTGNNLEICNGSLQWQLQQICGQACDAAKKQCAVTVTCTAGTRRCNGLQVQICNATGTAWLTTETCAISCTTGLCTGACTPAAKRCNGNTPEVCNAGGTAWTAQAACSSTFCYYGACAEPSLLVDADANKTLDGEHVYAGDVIIKSSSTVKVPSGKLIIRAKTVTMDATSSISVTATGDDPRGRGTDGGATSCYTGCCTAYGTVGGGGGGFSAAGGSGASSFTCSCSYGSYSCNPGTRAGGALYGIADDEAASGGSGGACSGTGGGKGGGMIAIYAEKIDIKGSITANGLSGSGCAGGGSGGGIVLRATDSLIFSGSASVAGGVAGTNAGAGAQGTIKLLHGNTKSITGVTTGKVFASYMPPNDLSSATHPNPQRWYNDDAANFEIAWSNPFTQSGGYYPNLNTTYAYIPGPSNSLYQTPEMVQVAASKLVAGSNYLHVAVIGPAFDPSTIEGRFLIKINTAPPSITSQSHASETTWYSNFNPFLEWTLPKPDDNTTKFYYVLDRFYDTQPDKSATSIPMNLADPASSKRLLLNISTASPGIWFFHLIAEDTMGYLTKQAARFRLQIGADPGKGGVSGTITDSTTGGFVNGATVTLNRGVHTVTTNAQGAYAFTNNTVFAQDYEVRVTKTGYKPGTQTVSVKTAQTATVNLALVPE
jgi:hypothetical protein